MTLEEIDAELMRLPRSPTTPEDIEARANMMLKRFEVEAATRRRAAELAAAAKHSQWGLPLVNVPADIGCVMLPNGRTVLTDLVDGRRVMRLIADEVRTLSIHNRNWIDLNPELAKTF